MNTITSKEKIKMPNEELWAKSSPEIPLSWFCVGHLLLGKDLSLKYSSHCSETPMEKTDFLCAWLLSIVKMSIHLRDGSPCLLPLLVLRLHLTWHVPAATVYGMSHVCGSCCVWKTLFSLFVCFWFCFFPLRAFTVSVPPRLHGSLSPEGSSLIKTSCLGLSVLNSLTLWILFTCGFPSTAGETSLWLWLNKTLIYGYSRM